MTPHRQSGFTLLEVIVSLLIFGLLMAGLVQGTQFGIQAWAAQSRQIGMQQDLAVVDRTLRNLAGSMDQNTTMGAEAFSGNARSMGFTGTMPEALTAFRTRQVDAVISVTPAHNLVLRWAPHYKNPVGTPLPHVTTLVSGVDHIEMAYETVVGQQERWVTDWQQPGGLPGLVRMQVVFLRGDPRHWPPIIAAVNAY